MDKNSNSNKRAKMESEYDVKDIIIIDNGADTVKVGISGEDYPRVINKIEWFKKKIKKFNLVKYVKINFFY